MRIVNIYAEGIGDIIFIGQFITKHFKFKFNYELGRLQAKSEEKDGILLNIRVFDPAGREGGIDKKKITNLINEIRDVNIPTGIESIIIMDTDTSNHRQPPGSFKLRNDHLNHLKNKAHFDHFLIPNNSLDGNLESLLDNIISENGKAFYKCLASYVECLKLLGKDESPPGLEGTTDFDKTRMDWYVYMMGKKDSSTSSNRDYMLAELWDLESDALNPLKNFFTGILER